MQTPRAPRHDISRRAAIGVGLASLAAWRAAARSRPQPGTTAQPSPPQSTPATPLFEISLAEWSVHRALKSGDMTNLDFPGLARTQFDIGGVEYVNTFFKDRARDEAYLADLHRRCDDHGVRSVLIMCDDEGALGDPDASARARAVENHHRWIDAAAFLGCHSIRVNAQSAGTPEEQERLVVEGLSRLADYGDAHGINVIVENHGGISSNGAWLAGVMRRADHPRLGTLPDFGNFCLDWDHSSDPAAWYDRYRGVEELMPFARGVSAKSHDFDDAGDETHTDFHRMMRIVLDAGYRGFVGVEYEGEHASEHDGIRKTKALLERVRDELTPEYQGAP